MKINLKYIKSLEFFLFITDLTLLVFIFTFYFIGIYFYNYNIESERKKDQIYVLSTYYDEINQNLVQSINYLKIFIDVIESSNITKLGNIQNDIFNIIFTMDYSYKIKDVIYPKNYTYLDGFDLSKTELSSFRLYNTINGVYVIDSYSSFYSGKYSILLIYNSNNRIYVAELNLDRIFHSMEKNLNYKNYNFLLLSKPNNTIIKRSKDFYLTFWNSNIRGNTIVFQNKKYYFSEKVFDFLRISVVALVDEKSYDFYKSITYKFLLGLILFVVLSIIFRMVLLNKYNMKPIKNLVKTIQSGNNKKFECNNLFYEWEIVQENYNGFIDKIDNYSNDLRIQLEEKSKISIALQDYKNFLINVLDSLNTIIIIINKNKNVVLYNRISENIINTKQKNEKNKIFDLNNFFYVYLKYFDEALEKKEIITLPKELLIFNNRYKYFEFYIIPFINNKEEFLILKMDDISEKVKIQDFLQNNENIITLSSITKSLSVNINNPLEAITQSTQLLKRRLDKNLQSNIEFAESLNININDVYKYLDERKVIKNIENIDIATEKIVKLVDLLLSFGKTVKKEKRKVKTYEIIDGAIRFLNDYIITKGMNFTNIIKELSYNIEVVTYEYDIIRILFNLLKNSYEALLSKEFVENVLPFIKIKSDYNGKQYRIIIEDNGIGIKDIDLEKVFSPFWTTKKDSEHLGLGLTNAISLVKDLFDGDIYIQSTENVGTIVTVILNLS